MSALTAPASPPALVAEDEVLTGEAVALDLQPIGAGLKAIGGAIDLLASILAYIGVMIGALSLANAGLLTSATMQIVGIVMLVVCFVAVPTIVETLTRGRSLGRLAVGGRIVRTDGGAIGFRHALIRALVGVLEILMTLGSIALLVAIFTPRAQRLGDLVAGTYSERTRTPALPPPAPGLPAPLADWAEVADVSRLPVRIDARVARFATSVGSFAPATRTRIAAELVEEVRPFVSPVPDAPPEMLLLGVAAVRRERDLAALRRRSAVAAALAGRPDD
ncbi:RDD family protein [Microbacterium sp. gxy059]|uniref:RDD family protein n=1 Tax=Microbacterium sp. gxy059 TaxID=2957199 RepID=UPI003D99ECFD